MLPGPKASIVHSPDFEAGCVRVLRGRQDRLTRAEKAALLPFVKSHEPESDSSTGEEDEALSFVEQARNRRRLAQAEVKYEQLKTIAPTSNLVERGPGEVSVGNPLDGPSSISRDCISKRPSCDSMSKATCLAPSAIKPASVSSNDFDASKSRSETLAVFAFELIEDAATTGNILERGFASALTGIEGESWSEQKFTPRKVQFYVVDSSLSGPPSVHVHHP
ncbi:unnamed protein product [Phytophthora lilii]|uniref:Unnamed protein product n=1 Tax=Phytophthora lilii TaxID=2077276 RepID=A0A9W6WPY2_9STRA|nr:unnamed protein product [Phytophthora lilii]